MKQQRKEDAVSPVIGVMLMLVVTVVIAAVITGFAMDLSKDTDSSPMALFELDYIDVENSDGANVKSFGIKHKGGDAVPLKDIEITYVASGAGSSGFINTPSVSVDGGDDVVTVGDIIIVTPNLDSDYTRIMYGATVTWTMSHTKTGGVITKGEFIALPM